MIIHLSYPVTPATPLYPGTPRPERNFHRSMETGDGSNHALVTFSCHTGTHVDAPLHFCKEGASVSEILACSTSFYPSYCWDVPRGPDRRISAADLDSPDHRAHRDAQAVLIRTGFWRFRSTSPEDYIRRNPVIDPDVADLMRSTFPALRLIGIDTISIANPGHRELGHACHQAFLCRDPPILILEDADLSDHRLGKEPFTLTICPVIVDTVEATPVIALAEPDKNHNRTEC